MADKYLIRVTAGPAHDPASHVEVPVNSPRPVRVAGPLLDAELNVRVHNYVRGLPRDAPPSSPYFERGQHAANGDQYSIAVRFRLRRPGEGGKGEDGEEGGGREGEGTGTAVEDDGRSEQGKEGGVGAEGEEEAGEGEGGEGDEEKKEEKQKEEEEEEKERGVSALDLQFGNDFDHPIRDRLPPGFGTAMNIVKWWIDPGLEGDPNADKPYLYGPALSSFNAVHVGEGEYDEDKGGLWFEEGGDEAGMAWRRDLGAPDDARARMKWALRKDSKEKWVWEYGRTYGVDFFNPYIDFSEFALRLPGFNLPIMKYWDGQGLRSQRKRSHKLRYVLRNRSTGQVYLVVLFTLHIAEDVNEDGTLKPAALTELTGQQYEWMSEQELELEPDEEDFKEEETLNKARHELERVELDGEAKTKDEDVD